MAPGARRASRARAVPGAEATRRERPTLGRTSPTNLHSHCRSVWDRECPGIQYCEQFGSQRTSGTDGAQIKTSETEALSNARFRSKNAAGQHQGHRAHADVAGPFSFTRRARHEGDAPAVLLAPWRPKHSAPTCDQAGLLADGGLDNNNPPPAARSRARAGAGASASRTRFAGIQ